MNDLHHSRNLAARPRAAWACRGVALTRSRILFLLAGLLAMRVTQAADLAATNTPSAIPWNQIGAKAGADYQGDGLAVTPAGSGARLHCVFQRLDGEATPEGLWLTSTVTNTVSDPSSVAALRRVDRFRVTAIEVGRAADMGSAAQPRRGDMFIARAQPNPIQPRRGGMTQRWRRACRFLQTRAAPQKIFHSPVRFVPPNSALPGEMKHL